VIRAVGIVIPAHDEERFLTPCLNSVVAACRALPESVASFAVVVLDDCSDDSQVIVRSFAAAGIAALSVRCLNVGEARAAGVRRVLRHFESRDPSELWIATTDADSQVPASWLVDQLAIADTGVDGIAGTIRIDDWGPYPSARVRAFIDFYDSFGDGDGDAHGHVHGANLGVRADAYLAARGFSSIDSGEDHSLFEELERTGKRLISTRKIAVTTSARLSGRAPRGFADFLRTFANDSADACGASCGEPAPAE
jgi:glycosyltransferase involved in cell wall biosynthesis